MVGKVLIVDDELLSTKVLSMFLEEEGLRVQCALSAQEAIERGREFIPDVLVTDFSLGNEFDGVKLAKALKADNPKLQTILCSGMSMEEVVLNDPETGIIKVLEKPYSLDEVLLLIRQFCS